ncbi:MAG: peptidoglycan DD-metalloendopeptidase family protein [Gallionella sp.]|nr:peptidoglycan DD-metalloendopeptidase family protein [Gallionella sp.]
MRLTKRLFIFLVLAAVLAGCASEKQSAPVIDRSAAASKRTVAAEAARQKVARESDWRPQVHIVQKGDTLFSIAFNYGFDYHELAELNGIPDPSVIRIGQEIRLFPGAAAARPVAPVESKPLGPPIKEQPKLVKYAYNEAAMAQIDKVQNPDQPGPASVVKPEGKAESKPAAKPETKPAAQAEPSANSDEDMVWDMPAQGKVIGGFSESANRKGIDIAGQSGQPIFASAPGKVVYSGSGLRGYGKLVIIKHNNTYLSAYAHNQQILVKEGQSVTRGQKIAEMGNTDADRVKLHFEVRRFGKPVDPAKYLSLGKS